VVDVERARLGSVVYGNASVLQAAMRAVLAQSLRAAGHPIGLAEHAVLRRVAQSPAGLSLTGLTDFLGASRALVRQTVARLSAAGLIASLEDPGDRRARLWQATPAGAAAVSPPCGRLGDGFPVVRALASLEAGALARLVAQLDELVRELGEAGADFGTRQDSAPTADVASFEGFFSIWLTVARAYRHLRAEQTRFLLGTTRQVLDTPAYMALYRLHERPSTTAALAAFLRVDQNTAARLVRRLETHGLVARSPGPGGRRETVNTPTDKGIRLLRSTPPIDPAGKYLAALRRLPAKGAELEEILRRAVAGYVDEPVIDHQIFHALLKQVSESRAGRPGWQVEGLHFRSAMAQFLTGVAVVTVADAEAPRAITVNSLTSVSLDPPILLVCFDRRSPSLRALLQRKSFGISILSESQRELADRFGRRETEDNPHTVGPEIRDELGGVPMLAGALARIVCDLEQSLEAGTHTVIFGAPRLVALHEQPGSAQPLGYWRSRYVGLSGAAAA
jgi:flavin reductase (DIM6/NTAB) family NADH-FMN oxidoreductase RutF/DNA-binding MarR family transcriptional regulator